MDEAKIKQQAKELLDKFARALEGIKTEEASIERKENRRQKGKKKAEIDRRIMFENAPRKKEDYVEAEKGGWV